MKAEKHRPALNRALFATQPLDSAALAPLITLLHRFTVAGDYELFVRRDGQLIARSAVRVVGELPGPQAPGPGDAPARKDSSGAPYQINLDLTTIGQAIDDCSPGAVATLAAGGVLGFYVGEGTGRYQVLLTRITGDEKVVELDSEKGLPEGDFFAVTLVRPGIYSISNRLADAQMKAVVALPKPGDYRPNQGTLVQAMRGGFEPGEASLLSGQSLLFQCQVPSRFVIELMEAAPEAADQTAEGKRRYTVRKRRPPQNT